MTFPIESDFPVFTYIGDDPDIQELARAFELLKQMVVTEINNKGGYGATRPSNPATNMMWFDTNLATPRTIWYDGTNWVDATGATV